MRRRVAADGRDGSAAERVYGALESRGTREPALEPIIVFTAAFMSRLSFKVWYGMY